MNVQKVYKGRGPIVYYKVDNMKITKIGVRLEDIDGDVETLKQFLRGRVNAGYGSIVDGFYKGDMHKAYVFECVDLEDNLVLHDSVEELVKSVRMGFDLASVTVIQQEAELEFQRAEGEELND